MIEETQGKISGESVSQMNLVDLSKVKVKVCVKGVTVKSVELSGL